MHLCKHVNTELVRSKAALWFPFAPIPRQRTRRVPPHATEQEWEIRCGFPLLQPVQRFRAPQRRPLWTWCSAASAEEEIRARLIKLFTAPVRWWIMCCRQRIKPRANLQEFVIIIYKIWPTQNIMNWQWTQWRKMQPGRLCGNGNTLEM